MPTRTSWGAMTETARLVVLDSVATRLKITLPSEYRASVERLLVVVEQAAARLGDVQVFSWTRRVQPGRMFRCGNQRVRARRSESGRDLIWVNCRTRACDYCGSLRAGEEAAALAKLFDAHGREVFAVFTTKAKAGGIVDLATRSGHAAVSLPQPDGRAVVVTSQARRDAAAVVSLDSSLAAFLQRLFEQVPPYSTARGDVQHRVRPNRVLRAVAEAHPELAQGRQERQDVDELAEWSSFPEPCLTFAIKHAFPLKFTSTGQISRISLVEVDPRLVEEFEQLERGGQGTRCGGAGGVA